MEGSGGRLDLMAAATSSGRECVVFAREARQCGARGRPSPAPPLARGRGRGAGRVVGGARWGCDGAPARARARARRGAEVEAARGGGWQPGFGSVCAP